MQHPFETLRPEYDSWVSVSRVRPEWQRKAASELFGEFARMS